MKDVFSCFVHLCHCIFENGDVRLSHFVSLSWVIKKSKSVSRTNAKSMLEHFVTKINCGKPLTFVTRSTILDFVVFPDTALIGVLLIIKASSSKTYFTEQKKPSYRTKNLHVQLKNQKLLLQFSNHEKCVFYLFLSCSFLILSLVS